MKVRIVFLLFFFAPFMALAEVHCGDFILTSSDDGFMHINGVRPETQQFNFLGRKGDYNNVKYEWMMATKYPGEWLGMEYIKRNGEKRILNVEAIQADMDALKQFATYNCVKVK